MNILAIESSCDETAVAIVSGSSLSSASKTIVSGDFPSSATKIHEDTKSANSASGNFATPRLLSNVVVSQVDIFKEYGGVIPEVAARSHLEAILPVIHRAFQDAGLTKKPQAAKKSSHKSQDADFNNKTTNVPQGDWDKIDAIAVTHTPGLLGSLLIGTLTARTLAILHSKPLYAVHHLKSHIYANWLEDDRVGKTAVFPTFPLLALVISGGHTQIIYMSAHNHFDIIGTTRDDAVGECFDKVAKILGLPYPGGPSIAQAAEGQIPQIAKATNVTASTAPTKNLAQPATKSTRISPGDARKYHFPHPQVDNLDFSFSGLKTAVLRAVQQELGKPISFPSHQLAPLLNDQQIADFAASFQDTAVDILLEKLEKAYEQYPDAKSLVIAGGVSANQRLREKARSLSKKLDTPVFFPAPQFSGDNGAMVGVAAYYEIQSGVKPTDPYHLSILPRSDIA